MEVAIPSHTERSADVEAIEAEAWAQLAEGLDATYRAQFGVEIVRVGRAAAFVAPGLDSPWLNRALGFGFDTPFDDQRLDELRHWYASRGAPRWMLQWCAEALPKKAQSSFVVAGARPARPMVKLWGSLDRVPPVPPTNLRVAEIGRDDAARFEATVLPAIEVPPELGPIIRAGVGRPGWRYYLAFDGTEAVAGIVVFVYGTAAWMGFPGTRAEHRGQGAQTVLIARASADARAMGARWVSGETYADANPPSPLVRIGAQLDGKLLYERQNFVFFTKPVSS